MEERTLGFDWTTIGSMALGLFAMSLLLNHVRRVVKWRSLAARNGYSYRWWTFANVIEARVRGRAVMVGIQNGVLSRQYQKTFLRIPVLWGPGADFRILPGPDLRLIDRSSPRYTRLEKEWVIRGGPPSLVLALMRPSLVDLLRAGGTDFVKLEGDRSSLVLTWGGWMPAEKVEAFLAELVVACEGAEQEARSSSGDEPHVTDEVSARPGEDAGPRTSADARAPVPTDADARHAMLRDEWSKRRGVTISRADELVASGQIDEFLTSGADQAAVTALLHDPRVMELPCGDVPFSVPLAELVLDRLLARRGERRVRDLLLRVAQDGTVPTRIRVAALSGAALHRTLRWGADSHTPVDGWDPPLEGTGEIVRSFLASGVPALVTDVLNGPLLRAIPERDVRAILQARLRDGTPEERVAVLSAAEAGRHAWAEDLLRERVEADPEPWVRVRALSALARAFPRATVPIVAALHDPAQDVRDQACGLLIGLEPTSASSELERRLDPAGPDEDLPGATLKLLSAFLDDESAGPVARGLWRVGPLSDRQDVVDAFLVRFRSRVRGLPAEARDVVTRALNRCCGPRPDR